MRLILAAKEDAQDMSKKNTRRINAIVNNALADLDEILIANDINELPNGPIKVAYDSIVSWSTESLDKVVNEKEAMKLATSIRTLVNKVRKPMEKLSQMNSQILELEEAIIATLESSGITLKKSEEKAPEPKEEKKPEEKKVTKTASKKPVVKE